MVFFVGHVFSDDSYYSYLSCTISDGNFAENYLGYPIFKLRVGHLYLTALFYRLFGINEFITILPVLLFSIINLFVAFKISYLVTSNCSISLISAFIVAVIPTEIVFATVSFVDLQSSVLINCGIYFYLLARNQHKFALIYLAAFFFGLSFLFKETIYFMFPIFLSFFIFELINKYRTYKYTLVVLVGLISIPIIEGLIYYLINNDFFYRNHILQENFKFAYYDFFPNTLQNSLESSYFNLVLNQIVQNLKYIFLRRFYLFLPLFGLLIFVFSNKKKYNHFIVFWFFGLIITMCCLPISIDTYRLLNLRNSWYIIPLFVPTALIIATYLNQVLPRLKIAAFMILFAGSMYMSNQYLLFFQKPDLNEMKEFLVTKAAYPIYTDHFTKYGVDLVLNYSTSTSTHRISGTEFSFNSLPANCYVIYNKKHIDELKLQGFDFPNFDLLVQSNFTLIKTFGDFKFFKKL